MSLSVSKIVPYSWWTSESLLVTSGTEKFLAKLKNKGLCVVYSNSRISLASPNKC